jgi:hypothetical protein
MQNLAGDYGCDAVIREELTLAGIEVLELGARLRAEVPTSITGRLGGFTFTRAWYYWIVTGPVPLDVAEEMYDHPYGRKDVRVAGHCGCPPPEEWARPDGDALTAYAESLGLAKLTWGQVLAARDSGDLVCDWYVDTYHIDTQLGLNLFAEKLREHGLVTGDVQWVCESCGNVRETNVGPCPHCGSPSHNTVAV